MKLHVVGSGSSGNSYLLTDAGGRSLLVEAGVHPDEVGKALRFDVSGLVGVLATHRHKDHAAYVGHYAERGRKVLALQDVFDAAGLSASVNCVAVEPMHGYKLGGFKVLPFEVSHDVPCVGFVIEHPEMGKLLFATDTMMVGYRFGGLNHVMIEANYSDALVDGNVDDGMVHGFMRERLMTTHMSLENAVGMLRANDLSGVNEVILIHLSDSNADAAQFRDRVVSATGKPVYIARKGLVLDLNKDVY